MKSHGEEKDTNIKGKTILITGANRGIGRALLEEALNRGAKRVYAGSRQPIAHSSERITPLTLDVTNATQIERSVGSVESLDILPAYAISSLYGTHGVRISSPTRCPSQSQRAGARGRALAGGIGKRALSKERAAIASGRTQPLYGETRVTWSVDSNSRNDD
jgi:NAD(P)-dependent dehydrogenase (short-subunit alcohol dehydrogenase family)